MKRISLMLSAALLALTISLAGCGKQEPSETPSDSAEASSATAEQPSASTENPAGSEEASSASQESEGVTLPEGFSEEDGCWSFTKDGLTVLIDAGVQEASLFSQLGYKDMSPLATYELPLFYPRMRELPDYAFEALSRTAGGFDIVLRQGNVRVCYHYGILKDALSLSAELLTGT